MGSPLLLQELSASDWRLQVLVADAVRRASVAGYDLHLTCVARSRERTLEIYASAGKTPPASSVHESKPCRGADAVARKKAMSRDVQADRIAEHAYAKTLADLINAQWIYPRGKQCALFHDVTGWHIHFQVPPEELTMVADSAGGGAGV